MLKPTPTGDRMEAYTTKMKAGTDFVAPVTASKLALMIRKQRAACSDQEAYTIKTMVVLDAAGLSLMLYAFYLAFAHEVGRVTAASSGESACIEVEATIVKWVARGLTRSVMENIRTGVFNVQPPASP